MNQKLTTEQRNFLLEKWWYYHKKSEWLLNDFNQQFPAVSRHDLDVKQFTVCAIDFMLLEG